MGPGNKDSALTASRAYMAGLGTTGVLIASFFMLLTVGSTLVAFRGVPGVASNGDLSSIELSPQQQQAERDRETLLAATNLFGDRATGPEAASARPRTCSGSSPGKAVSARRAGFARAPAPRIRIRSRRGARALSLP